MSWKKERFENFKLYAVTDIRSEDPVILDKIDAAYQGGADIVQLRSKIVPDQILYRMGLKVKWFADKYKKLFFMNDRVDLALAVGAHGVHLGQNDLPVGPARDLSEWSSREFFLIGKSTHSLEQAIKAEKEQVDYIAVGPVFGTPTKPDYSPVGLDLLRKIKSSVKIPWVAIGGIDLANVGQVFEAGARRAAVVRAIFGADDVYEATRKLREKIEEFEEAPST